MSAGAPPPALPSDGSVCGAAASVALRVAPWVAGRCVRGREHDVAKGVPASDNWGTRDGCCEEEAYATGQSSVAGAPRSCGGLRQAPGCAASEAAPATRQSERPRETGASLCVRGGLVAGVGRRAGGGGEVGTGAFGRRAELRTRVAPAAVFLEGRLTHPPLSAGASPPAPPSAGSVFEGVASGCGCASRVGWGGGEVGKEGRGVEEVSPLSSGVVDDAAEPAKEWLT